MDDKPTVEQLVSVYIKIRDAKEAAKRAYDEREAELNEQLDMISGQILEICKQTGADSIKTKYGTAMRSVKSRYWTNDWESMYQFIRDHNIPDLLERRIHQTNMKTWIEDNPGLLPQGLNNESRYSATVRRSK